MDKGAKLYAAYLEGDDRAVSDLIREYYDGLSLYINSLVNDPVLSDEIAEDTVVKLVTKKPRFKYKASFKTWLYAIGRNMARDKLKLIAKKKYVPLDNAEQITDGIDVESLILEKEENAELYKGLMMLKPEYRQALWLVYFEEMPIKEVARVMNRSESSVYHLISRGKFALRSSLTGKIGIKKGEGNE